MSASYFDLLKYAATGQASPSMTYFDRMRASTLMGGVVKTLTGQPPLTFKADGTPLISWSMKGNGSQQGTPTPDNPVMPEFVGVKTGNLFDINATPTKYDQSTIVTVDGQTLTITGTWYIYYEIDVVPNTDYYVKWTIDYAEIEGRGSIAILTVSGQTIHNQSASPYSFNSGENQRIRLLIYSASNTSATVRLSNIMLNLGSTALPYEPFGWAEKITCAGQTVPVYLGQTQTVRRIKKLVLTGEEQWQFFSDVLGAWQFYINDISLGGVALSSCMSNIATYGATAVTRQRYDYGCYLVTAGNGVGFQMKGAKDTFTGIASWKSYLAAQYAAGTPVTVWYVLATPETGITNEPLAKIGDYADELHSTDAAVTIPAVKGQNTLTVDTELQPSEMTITYKG